MNTQLYVHGRLSTWLGVCEVHQDRQRYIYHSSWPQRSPTPSYIGGWIPFSREYPLDYQVRMGYWQLMYPTQLALPSGA